MTIQEFVRTGMVADPSLGAFFDPVLGGTMTVSLNNPEEMRVHNVQGVSVWLYRVERDDQRLNAPPARPTANRLLPTPLPLRLHYLVTPVVLIDPAFPLVSPGQEQEILGKVIQLLFGGQSCAAPICGHAHGSDEHFTLRSSRCHRRDHAYLARTPATTNCRCRTR
jgi:hypothetical protein